MNKEQILSIIRYVLTTIGIYLVANGKGDEMTITQISGGIMAAISGIWSIVDKTDGSMAAKVEAFQAKTKK